MEVPEKRRRVAPGVLCWGGGGRGGFKKIRVREKACLQFRVGSPHRSGERGEKEWRRGNGVTSETGRRKVSRKGGKAYQGREFGSLRRLQG